MTKTILTVDDSRMMREMLLMSLREAGFNVVQAEDGLDGLSKLADAKPDVIITDINMPRMDGFGFIEGVRKDARYRATPILVLSTESDAAKKIASARTPGATGWIVKAVQHGIVSERDPPRVLPKRSRSMDPLDAIKTVYFQECAELLADLEQGLLALESGEDDGDTINAVFRAVHSVKGGAGAFGFNALVSFAHVFETTLDDMRSGRLTPDNDSVKVMLRASDVLSDLVLAAKGEGSVDEAPREGLWPRNWRI